MTRPVALLSFFLAATFQVAQAGLLTSLVNKVGATVQSVDPLLAPYLLPQDDANATRAAGVLLKQATFLYGPPVAGGPYFPAGPLGLARAAADQVEEELEQGINFVAATVDAAEVIADAAQYNGLKTLDDYVAIYKDHLKGTLPGGPELGSLTNYTQDLFFSMERLANSPYAIRRLNPTSDSSQFDVDDYVTLEVANMTLNELFQDGRLFYVDYRAHLSLPRTMKYAAACDAYFFIHPQSGQFLPLAIRTNVGSNLIYTPMDTPSEWLLAKMMFNVNDFFFAQTAHLAGTHEVVQIAYMAAIRTLSDNHPVLGLLNRIMYQVFAIQPLAQTLLFLPGAVFDQLLPFTGLAAQGYSSDLYTSGSQGLFKSNYFMTNLRSRGLVNSTIGPDLPSFPFYDDGSKIFASLRTFITAFVSSYYYNDARVTGDKELQAWVAEAQGPAEARDFPTISTTTDLIDVLTHMSHLVTFSHHAVNTNALLSISGTLPFHPNALYKPLPVSKGAVNVTSFLPPVEEVALQFSVGGWFSRMMLAGTNRTLIHMFEDEMMLSRMNSTITQASTNFANEMTAFSKIVKSRNFDSNGLSQGMPFLWNALDPDVIPYSCTI
ncbi:lipoxygenase [Xylariales sp. PMI_506]|nr:lipoxygenase [Xylariales sp. PMI_506]